MSATNKKRIIFKIILAIVGVIIVLALIPLIRDQYAFSKHKIPIIDKSVELKLGDHKYSLTKGEKGSIYLCNSISFESGASRVGEWIDLDKGVWYPLSKAIVHGSVSWSNASSSFTVADDKRIIYTNDLPTTHATGIFPIERTDSAYYYDQNPSPIKEQNIRVVVPKNPKIAESPSCLPWGPLGYSISGIPIENPFDTQERDAPAYEIQDACGGHSQPEKGGVYHYHNLSPDSCLGIDGKSTESMLIGYALDGFGIYKEYKNGKMLTTEDLDECHGHVSEVMWNGREQSVYHYVATKEFPYFLGCYKGEINVNDSDLFYDSLNRIGRQRSLN